MTTPPITSPPTTEATTYSITVVELAPAAEDEEEEKCTEIVLFASTLTEPLEIEDVYPEMFAMEKVNFPGDPLTTMEEVLWEYD